MRRHRSPRSLVTLASASALAIAVAISACGQLAAPATSGARTSGSTSSISWAFSAPDGIAADQAHVWVADSGDDSVYELSAATGGLVRIISGPRYRLDDPDAIVAAGAGVWVASANGNAVTELSAVTGTLIRVIRGRRFQFGIPQSLAAAAGRIWVVSTDSVTELSARTGALLRVISGPEYRFSTLYGVAAAGARAWVPNGTNVTVVSASTGRLVRLIGGDRYRFNEPDVAAVAAGRLWVGNFNGHSVTEIGAGAGTFFHATRSLPNVPLAIAADARSVWIATNAGAKGSDGTGPDGAVVELSARTGALLRVLSAPRYDVGDPQALALDGGHVWVASVDYPGPGGSVTELNAATGALIRVITGSGQLLRTAAALAARAAGGPGSRGSAA